VTAKVVFEAMRVLIELECGTVIALDYPTYREAIRQGKALRRALALEQRLAASAAQEEGKKDRAGVSRLPG
jgi:hypothetical protein